MKLIALTSYGSSRSDVNMGDAGIYIFVTKYNYSASCWCLDILDAQGNQVLTGLMLVPDVDILFPYPLVSEKMGRLILTETVSGSYQSPDGLGVLTQLTWYPA
jgi:hypothetical protein